MGYPETIEVNQFELKFASNGDFLCSGGLGPCIAIAIYNKKTKEGAMNHHPAWVHDKVLDIELQKIIMKLGKIADLQVVVAGANLDTQDDKEQREIVRSSREYVTETLSSFFKGNQINITWTDDNSFTEMTLDTATSKVELDPSEYRNDEEE
jgi:hypothetical protein